MQDLPPLGHHLVFRLQDDRVFAPSVVLRRRFARIFGHLATAFPLLAWRVVDTHLHVVGLLDDAQVDELTRRLRLAVARLHRKVPLLLARRIPVKNQWHLAEVFGYCLRQDKHHGVGSDILQEGSAVLDLLGMRLLGDKMAERVREHLPRVQRTDLLKHVGVAQLDERVDLAHLREATCAAFALDSLAPRIDEAVLARTAAIHAARGHATAAVASALGMEPRAVLRLGQSAPLDGAVPAIRLQMALRAAHPPGPAAFVKA